MPIQVDAKRHPEEIKPGSDTNSFAGTDFDPVSVFSYSAHTYVGLILHWRSRAERDKERNVPTAHSGTLMVVVVVVVIIKITADWTPYQEKS